MADKSVGELIAAQSVTPTDLFVLEQNGTAKKLTGQILENWLVSFADGHGGIQSIKKLSTSGLVDTYRITLADTTTFDFVVNNGRGITGISKTSTSGLVDTYTISYNNGTTSKFTVTNGAKGDKGDNAYIWIKYASQKPTETSHSMGDLPDDWIGIYSGNASTAPTDWKQYKWFKHKGEKGDTGAAATLVNRSVTYQVSDSGTIIPSGSWGSSIPVVSQGKYLWTKTEVRFNTGDPIVSYSVARMGVDGTGSVSSVAGVSPDETGNVTLTAADVGALAGSGGDVTGEIRMNGQPISGLNDPTEDTQAARKGYVDASVRKAAPRNILDNSDFTSLVAQAGISGKHGSVVYAADRWKLTSGTVTYTEGTGLKLNGTITQELEKAPTGGSCFVGMVSGTATIALSGNTITITSSGGVLKWAALYEGEYTAETLPYYQQKGIAQERIACHRFFARADAWRPIYGYASWDGEISLFLPTLTEMRINPTATTLKGTLYINGSSIDIDETPANVIKTTQGLQILLRTKTPENPKHNCALNLAETAAYFSADL